MAINDTLNQLNLRDTYSTFHPNPAEYILFNCTWDILQNRSHARHKTSLSKFKKIEIISSTFLNTKL